MSKQFQLHVFSALAGIITIGSIVYVSIVQPDYLRKSREGTPFFTPQVVNPDTGEGTDLDELIRHYKSGS